MKTYTSFATYLTVGVLYLASGSLTQAAGDLPHRIAIDLGTSEFIKGDSITITLLTGDRPQLEPGGEYVIEGSYTLASADVADLAWFVTSRSSSGAVPVQKEEHLEVKKGSGTFRLKKRLSAEGWAHLSFYVGGQAHGGVYFGQKGVEDTVLRTKSWSDFSAPGASVDGITSHNANDAIMAYLGQPVPPPADMDDKYTPANLGAAFADLTRRAGLKVQRLVIDDSEFPFLTYGRLVGNHEYKVLEQGLSEMKGYAYGGSVVGTDGKGSTYFALNMIPYGQFPSGQATACSRRLMIRLQLLADRARGQ
jgi:hypothetical protein